MSRAAAIVSGLEAATLTEAMVLVHQPSPSLNLFPTIQTASQDLAKGGEAFARSGEGSVSWEGL